MKTYLTKLFRHPLTLMCIFTLAGSLLISSNIKSDARKPFNSNPCSYTYLRLTKNHEEIIASANWAAGSEFSFQLKGHQNVTVELVKQKSKNRHLLHLINYNIKNQPLIQNMNVKLRFPETIKSKKVYVISPDGSESDTLVHKVNKQIMTFTVPKLKIYDLIVVKTVKKILTFKRY